MNLPKAIKLVEDYWRQPLKSPTLAQVDAMKLLIEAGKRVDELRTYSYEVISSLLPGETED